MDANSFVSVANDTELQNIAYDCKKLQKYVDGFHLHKGREVADFHRDLTANFFACAIGINLNDTARAC